MESNHLTITFKVTQKTRACCGRYILKILYLLMASVLLLSCSKQNDFSGAYIWGGGIKYKDTLKQKLIVQQLVENEIEFVTENNDMITYKLSDLSKVRLIQDLIEGREKEPPIFGQTAVVLPETEFVALFEKRANESQIRVEYQDGSYKYFMWEFKYRKQIYIIEQNVRFELHENQMRQLKTKKNNPSVTFNFNDFAGSE